MLLKHSTSFCTKTNKIVDVDIIEEGGKVFMIKKCCGEKVLLEENSHVYKELMNPTVLKENDFKKLGIAVTEKCNLNCPRCYENSFWYGGDLEFKKIKNLLKKFKGRQVVICGGEPTVRDDIFKIIKLVSSYGFFSILATNGLKLANFDYVMKLKESGLNYIVFAFDSYVDDAIYKFTHGKRLLKVKLKALENIRKVNIPTTLSMTLIRNVNENEIQNIVEFAAKNVDVVREVRIRTLTPFGRHMKIRKYTMSEMLEKLSVIGIKWEDIKNELSFRRYLARFLKQWNILPISCRINFIIKLEKERLVPIGKFLKSKMPFILIFNFFRLFGIKNLFELVRNRFDIEKTILNSKDFLFFSLRVWRDKNDIDLDEIKMCHSGYTKGKEVLPFCLFHIKKEFNVNNIRGKA